MLCLGNYSTSREFLCPRDAAGPLFLLEVPERSSVAGKVATLDVYSKLDVHASLAHTLVTKNTGPPRRPQDLAVDNTFSPPAASCL